MRTQTMGLGYLLSVAMRTQTMGWSMCRQVRTQTTAGLCLVRCSAYPDHGLVCALSVAMHTQTMGLVCVSSIAMRTQTACQPVRRDTHPDHGRRAPRPAVRTSATHVENPHTRIRQFPKVAYGRFALDARGGRW